MSEALQWRLSARGRANPPMSPMSRPTTNQPQVLSATASTYASDVYSFGIVAWEVLSRELPWATVRHPRDIYIRVVLNELRPDIPADAPKDMADMMRACWAGEPTARPTFSTIMDGIKASGWSR